MCILKLYLVTYVLVLLGVECDKSILGFPSRDSQAVIPEAVRNNAIRIKGNSVEIKSEKTCGRYDYNLRTPPKPNCVQLQNGIS